MLLHPLIVDVEPPVFGVIRILQDILRYAVQKL